MKGRFESTVIYNWFTFLLFNVYSIPLNIEDKNERFVVKRCLIYLERLLCAYSMVDKEFVDILDWSLKEDMEQVIAYVTARIKDNKKMEFEEALLKCQGDKDEYSDIIIWFSGDPQKMLTPDSSILSLSC